MRGSISRAAAPGDDVVGWLLAGAALAGPIEVPGEGPLASRFSFVVWGVDDGLPQRSVNDLVQTRDGYLFAPTFAGLARFDGERFTVFDPNDTPGLPGARLTAAAVAPDGRVCVGSQYGQLAWVDERGTTSILPPPNAGNSGVIRDLLFDDSGLWAATDTGLYLLSGDEWRFIGGERGVLELARGSSGVWGLGDGALLQVEDGRAVEVPVPDSGDLLSIAADPAEHRLWVATARGLATLSDDGVFQLRDPRRLDRAQIALDAEGRLWLGSASRLELLKVDQEVSLLASWTIGTTVRAFFTDREGHVWIGTDARGLLRAEELPFERFGTDRGLPEPSASAVETGGREVVVAAGCSGLVALRDGRFQPIMPPIGCVAALHRDDDGTLWAGYDAFVARVDDTARVSEFPRRVLSIARPPGGPLWVGTEGAGAYTVTAAGPVPVPGLERRVVAAIAVARDGAVWLGLDGGVGVVRAAQLTVVGPEIGLPRAGVRALLLDPDGTAWVGTYGGGLARMRGTSVVRFTEDDGLPENVVSVILDDGSGNLWMNGNRGVWRVARSDLDAVAAGIASTVRAPLFSTGEGNGGSSPAGGVDARGRLWFATLDGAVAFDPADLRPNLVPPIPVVEEVVVDGKSWDPDGGFEAPPGRRELSVRYTAAVLGEPRLARFEYRLLPADADWREAGDQRQVRYAQLPPGDYAFEVRAANEGGVWSTTPAHVEFRLQPRISETTPFRLLVALAAGVAVSAGVAWRIREVRRRSRELQGEVGQRRLVEAELRRSEAYYRGVFEAASDGLLLAAPDGTVLDANPAASALFGRSVDQLRATRVQQLVAHDGGEQGIHADGSRFPVRTASVDLDRTRRLLSVVDLGPVVDLRARLEQAERLEAVGRLAGGVAHDFNNLLMVVRGNAAELRGLTVDPAGLECVDQITHATDRASDLTRQLLLFGRRQILRPVPLDASGLLAGLAPMLRRLVAGGVNLTFEGDPDLWVAADATQLELAVVNLVLNAADAVGASGSIALTARRVSGARANARWPQVDALVEQADIAVADTGTGIAPEVLSRLFEPFFTTKGDRGTGLGLAGVHGFATQSGGQIAVESTPGRGATFHLVLPTVPTPRSSPAHRGPVASASAVGGSETRLPVAGRSALVVDDDEFVRRTVERLLKSGGYQVKSVESGPAALAILAEGGVDVLVTDVLMPEMTGAELVRQAREKQTDLPVVFVSGYTREVLPEELDGPLLTKPFTRDSLLEAVSRALAGQRA